MARVGFFQMLLDDDMSWGEMAAINSAHDQAQAALDQGAMIGASVGMLQQRLAAQAKEIRTLKALVGVLAGVLRDTGVVDGDILDYRLEAALEEAAEEKVEVVTCLQCGRQVPKNRTTITGAGLVCDACA